MSFLHGWCVDSGPERRCNKENIMVDIAAKKKTTNEHEPPFFFPSEVLGPERDKIRADIAVSDNSISNILVGSAYASACLA